MLAFAFGNLELPLESFRFDGQRNAVGLAHLRGKRDDRNRESDARLGWCVPAFQAERIFNVIKRRAQPSAVRRNGVLQKLPRHRVVREFSSLEQAARRNGVTVKA